MELNREVRILATSEEIGIIEICCIR